MKYVALFPIQKMNLSSMQRYLHIKCIPVDLIYVEVLHQSENNVKPFSQTICQSMYHDPTSLHYIYKAITEEDRCIMHPHYLPGTLIQTYNTLPLKDSLDI